jgi:chemotaxis protein methyltransferase CheR
VAGFWIDQLNGKNAAIIQILLKLPIIEGKVDGLKVGKEEFKLLCKYIEDNCGIRLGDEKDYLIENRLSSLAKHVGCSTFSELYFRAKNDPRSGLRDKIIDAMTTNETKWFRDAYPFQVISDKILPEYAVQVQKGTRKKIRIWSAGCSTGQEPYSIAMIILELIRRRSYLKKEMFEIIATDISPSALCLAVNGRYDDIAISRGLPVEMKDRYFKKNGRLYSIKEEIKEMISFKRFNLQDSFIVPERFDIVFCRYVMIYFSDIFKIEILSKIAKVLCADGYLLLGASEFASGCNSIFEVLVANGGQYYKVRGQS